MLENCHLQEREKQVDNFLLFIKLLDDLLAEVVLGTLMILLLFLLLRLLLFNVYRHVRLVLILFNLVLDYASLDVLERLSSLLFQGDHIVTNQVH